MNFNEIINYPPRALVHTIRFSGVRLIQPETVSDHIVDMNAFAFLLNEKFNLRYGKDNPLSIQKLIYKIAIHDLDEALYCDIPRKFKYANDLIIKAIRFTVNNLLKENFQESMVTDIEDSKHGYDLESILTAVLDVVQCTVIIHKEVILLGNGPMTPIMKENLSYLSSTIENVKNLVQVNEYFGLDIVEEFLLTIYNKAQDDFSKRE